MKRLLLDTHIFLWWLKNEPMIKSVEEVIANPRNEIFVSAVTTWEISIKKSLGKLEAPDNLEEIVEAKGFEKLPIGLFHSEKAGTLPIVDDHKDPFDRMLIVQAQIEELTIITHDKKFQLYDIPIIWVN